jgi:hypothetical protein
MYVRTHSSAQLTEPHSLIRTLAYLLAWAMLLATIGLIAAYLSPAPAGSTHIEAPGRVPTSAPAPAPTPAGQAAATWLGQAGLQCQPGEVRATAAAGLVPDSVQVRADRADADVQVTSDLGVGTAPGHQGHQFLLTGTEQ